MKYHERLYDCVVILGDPQAPPAWHWRSWLPIAGLLEPIIEGSRGKAAVRSQQLLAGSWKQVPFGRIGWNADGHMKWVHGSPTNSAASQGWRFFDAEVWAPSWSQCGREARPPDLFFSIVNEEALLPSVHTLRFDSRLLLATASDFPPSARTAARHAANSIASTHRAVLALRKTRPWGLPFGDVGFTNAIQDLLTTGLFRPGPLHGAPISPDLLAEPWSELGA